MRSNQISSRSTVSYPFTFSFLYPSYLAHSNGAYRYQATTTRQPYPQFTLCWSFLYVHTSSLFNPHHWHPEVASTIQNLQYSLPTSSAHASVFKDTDRRGWIFLHERDGMGGKNIVTLGIEGGVIGIGVEGISEISTGIHRQVLRMHYR